MSVQQLRDHIRTVLERYFPDVPVYVEGEKPKISYFHPELISATLDRQREGRYLAIYRFGIRYEQGSVVDAERMADELSNALAGMEQEDHSFRIVRQAWVAGIEEKGPLFTVDYMHYLQMDKPKNMKMGHLLGGERLK